MFTFLRATSVDYIFMPFARRGGISTKKDLIRFAEQAWLLIYYSVFWTLGMVCHLITRQDTRCGFALGLILAWSGLGS